MKKVFAIIALAAMFTACNNEAEKTKDSVDTSVVAPPAPIDTATVTPPTDTATVKMDTTVSKMAEKATDVVEKVEKK